MIFETNNIYHIYNQGNNHQKIFFYHKNYLYFLRKIKDHILPYADLLAWCLMPNHFHLLVFVNKLELGSEAFTKGEKKIYDTLTQSEGFTTLNDSIGTMLRSYTRAINIQQERSGSLFRRKTKAKFIARVGNEVIPSMDKTPPDKVADKKASLTALISDREYLQDCFNYIHDNPVEAGLVTHIKEWEFSSYLDYTDLRKWNQVNIERANELGLEVH